MLRPSATRTSATRRRGIRRRLPVALMFATGLESCRAAPDIAPHGAGPLLIPPAEAVGPAAGGAVEARSDDFDESLSVWTGVEDPATSTFRIASMSCHASR